MTHDGNKNGEFEQLYLSIFKLKDTFFFVFVLYFVLFIFRCVHLVLDLIVIMEGKGVTHSVEGQTCSVLHSLVLWRNISILLLPSK